MNRCNCPLTEKEDQFQIVNNWTEDLGAIIRSRSGADLRYARNLRVPFRQQPHRHPELQRRDRLPIPASTGRTRLCHLAAGRGVSFQRYVSTSTNAKEFQKRTFFYGQDTWRATRNLTVTSDCAGSCTSRRRSTRRKRRHSWTWMTATCTWPASAASETTWAGTSRKRTCSLLASVSPISLNDKTVIRAGYGRSFDIGVFGSIFGHAVTQNLPVLTNQKINSATTTSAGVHAGCRARRLQRRSPFLPTVCCRTPEPVNSRARPNPLRFPEIDAWNLAIQHALTPTLTLTMAYVGNKGTYTLGDSSGNTTNPNEAAIDSAGFAQLRLVRRFTRIPASAGNLRRRRHTDDYNLLRRYYGASLPACRDANYVTPQSGSKSAWAVRVDQRHHLLQRQPEHATSTRFRSRCSSNSGRAWTTRRTTSGRAPLRTAHRLRNLGPALSAMAATATCACSSSHSTAPMTCRSARASSLERRQPGCRHDHRRMATDHLPELGRRTAVHA